MKGKPWVLLALGLLLLSSCDGGVTSSLSSESSGQTPATTSQSTSTPKASSTVYTSTPRNDLTNLFVRHEGWNGADGVYTFKIGDKILWYFSDTFVGTVNADRQRINNAFINNSYAVSDLDGSNIVFHYGENPISSAFKAPEGSYYWPQDSYVKDNTLYIFALKMKAAGGLGDILGVDIVKATFDGTSVSESEIIPLSGLQSSDTALGAYLYGSYLEKAEDGYLYIYGYRTINNRKNMVVCRMLESSFPGGSLEYLNSEGWSTSVTSLKELASDISPEFRLYHVGSKVYLAYILSTWSGKIFLSEAPTALDVFPRGEYVYYCPEEVAITKNTICYNAKIQSVFSDGSKLVISYHVNSLTNADNANAEIYRPRFIEVKRTDGGSL
jgi:hypothetical protein